MIITYLVILCRKYDHINGLITCNNIKRLSLQSNSVIATIFVRYNRISLCTKLTNFTAKTVRYNRVFVNNRVHFNRASLYILRLLQNQVTWLSKVGIRIEHFRAAFSSVHRHFTDFTFQNELCAVWCDGSQKHLHRSARNNRISTTVLDLLVFVPVRYDTEQMTLNGIRCILWSLCDWSSLITIIAYA